MIYRTESKLFSKMTFVGFFFKVLVIVITFADGSDVLLSTQTPRSNPSQCEKIDWPNFYCSLADDSCFTIQDKCDGHSDCSAGEDECHSMCVETFQCTSSSRNSKCIAMDQFCDGVEDCSDGSDELKSDENGFSCSNAWQVTVNLSKSTWQHWKERRVPWNAEAQKWFQSQTALEQKKCKLPDQMVCDGINHCGDHSDECSESANCGSAAKFICNNKKCISRSNFCDGRNDCGDNSDECHPDCMKNYQCANGQCISMNQFCDGKADCVDGSDEMTMKSGFTDKNYFNGSVLCSNVANLNLNLCLIPSKYLCDGHEHCFAREDECTAGCQFSHICSNGRCLVETKRCNGFDDCGDMSDECGYDCSLQFHCDNGTCLSFDRFCDGEADCLKGEDEITEITDDGDQTCINKFSLSKTTKECVLPSRYLCDGMDHCQNRTDECQPYCPKSFYCDDNQTCISHQQLFDENLDCKDGTDEPGYGRKIVHQRGFKCRISKNGEISRRVLPQKLLHNNIPDCIDYSDLCFQRDIKTGFRSLNNCSQCLFAKDIYISQRQICDGIFDCSDLSDECLCDHDNTPSICRHICFDATLSSTCPCPLGFVPCLLESDLNDGPFTAPLNGSRTCIPASDFCDGVPDCPNGSDERFCNLNDNSTVVEHSERMECSQFQLKNFWTPQFAFRCDNTPECFNMEDECDSGCPNLPNFCKKQTSAGTYNCPKNEILPGKMVCNGRQNCEFGPADEMNCPDRFYCHNGTTIISVSNDKVCDFSVDCEDESDEANCPKTHFYCEDNKPPYFIPLWKKMDGNLDCQDGSDECPRQNFENLIFSSRQFLIKEPFLQFMIWVMGLVASFGNFCVFVHTINVLRHQKKFKLTKVAVVNNFLVLNLCTSDFLMGVFLLLLAGKNAQTSGQYCLSDRAWRSGLACRFLGVIATLSAEVSLTTLAVLASYRLYCVLRPIQSRGMKLHKAILHILWTWALGFLLALLPLYGSYQRYFTTQIWIQKNPYFSHDLISPERLEEFCKVFLSYNGSWISNISNSTVSRACSNWENLIQSAAMSSIFHETQGFLGYYSTHATCLPKLFLSKDDQSWEYSFGVTFFNFLLCLFIVVAYATLWSTRQVKKSSASSQSTRNLQKRIALLVCSDCACWLPVCIIAFMHLGGVKMSPSTYAFTAVILLPINSALNPVFYSNALQNLYTKTVNFLKRFETVNKLRQNIRNSFYCLCMKKKRKAQMHENETSLLQNATSGPDGSRILTELTFDYSSLPESTV